MQDGTRSDEFVKLQDVTTPKRVFFERERRDGKPLGYRILWGVSTDEEELLAPRLASFLTLSLITVMNHGS